MGEGVAHEVHVGAVEERRLKYHGRVTKVARG
jgi:hypothetical protein